MALLDASEFARWREEADRALEAARLQADANLHNWACFAAEQGAQLGLKALLHGIARGAWGHDLVRLEAESADALGPLWEEGLDATARRLGRHYIPARYPDAHSEGAPGGHYGAEDAEQAVEDAGALLAAADRAWQALVEEAEDGD